MPSIKAEDLAITIKASLEEWESDKWAKIEQLADEKGAELLERVKSDAPVMTGKYKRGFKVKKDKTYRQIKVTVYNKSKRKSLMHILEHGHASANGGRVDGIPHLRDNEKEVNEEFYKEAQKIYESK